MITKILIENVSVALKPGMSSADADSIALETAFHRAKRETGKKPVKLIIHRKSVDARKKDNIKLVYTVYGEVSPVKSIRDLHIKPYAEAEYDYKIGAGRLSQSPIVVGFGPAGIFCGMALAENGYRPVIYERGEDVDSRVKRVDSFSSGGEFNVSSNIQFGAGGAGTFSDGKLTTRIGDPLIAYVLKKLNELGAPEDICYKAKPHIGTDVLREVVKNADKRIRELGGTIHYNSRVEVNEDGISLDGEGIPADAVVLAVGHSARDTYGELIKSGYAVEPKPYSCGVRIEHLQDELDRAMFGEFAGDDVLGHAEYQVSMRQGNRGVYSFCMCPGGEVMAAASEEGGVVTNGMSRRARDGKNSNAALAVSVLPEDYGNTPKGAIEFQRRLEKAAFEAGGGTYAAPMQTVGDFLSGKHGTEPKRIFPTYRGGDVRGVDLHGVLPGFITDMLEAGLPFFGKRIAGFDASDVPMTGVETRTSSPIRIMRDGAYKAVGKTKIYPCGEGAGYAGGIVSAAIDGLRCAKAIMEEYSPKD